MQRFCSHIPTVLQVGSTKDLQVVYRLCALWFSLASDAGACALFEGVFRDLPTYKFVPLVYQVRIFVSE